MSLAFYLAGLIALAAAGYRARELRHQSRPTLRAFVVTLLSLGMALLVLAPASRALLDDPLGVPNLARWLGNSLTLTAACAIQTVFAHFTRTDGSAPPRTGLRVAILVLAVVSMGVLLLTSESPESTDVSYAAATDLQVLAYLLIYLCFLGAAMANALHMAATYARHVPERWLRVGMRIIAMGSVVGLVYVLDKAGLAVLAYRDVPTHGVEIGSPILAVLASVLLVIGSTIGTWAPGLGDKITGWNSYRRLKPLWAALHEEFPQIHAPVAGHRWDIRTRLYRRVIEIRDGQLQLMPYHDPGPADRAADLARAAGLDGQKLETTVQAAIVAAALQAKSVGSRPYVDAGNAVGPVETEPHSAELESELAWLEQVAEAFCHSAVVRAVMDERQEASGASRNFGRVTRPGSDG